jgi:ethanolamine ammonia-lyase small subunit
VQHEYTSKSRQNKIFKQEQNNRIGVSNWAEEEKQYKYINIGVARIGFQRIGEASRTIKKLELLYNYFIVLANRNANCVSNLKREG